MDCQQRREQLVEPYSFDYKNNVTIADVADEKSLPANATGIAVGDEISHRDSGSRNESSSTAMKQDDQPDESLESKPETVDELEKPVEESCNGSSDLVAKGSEKSEAVVRILESSGRRENSDVQSLAECRSEINGQSPAIVEDAEFAMSLNLKTKRLRNNMRWLNLYIRRSFLSGHLEH